MELTVRVTPRSSRNRIEIVDGKVKVRVTAPPVEGEANEAVAKVVADFCGVPKSTVWVSKGHSGREKTLTIQGQSDESIRAKLGILSEDSS